MIPFKLGIRLVIVAIIVMFIGAGCASNYANDGIIEVVERVDQQVKQVNQQIQLKGVVHNNQLLELIEKVRRLEESEIEDERKQLVEISGELNDVLEEVEELETQLKNYPEAGDDIEYYELYAYYELKWNEYNSLYQQYEKKVEKFNLIVEDYNAKFCPE